MSKFAQVFKMDYFGYFNARIAGRNAGAGIYSSARWATERVDGFPPPLSPMPERVQLRYVRERLNDEGTPFRGPVLVGILDEVAVALDGVDVPTPKYVAPVTKLRLKRRKQNSPKRLE